MIKTVLNTILFILLLLFCNTSIARKYYVNKIGNDTADGSLQHPFKSIQKTNSIHLNAGDIVLFQAGQIFNGTILLDSIKSILDQPIIITSYGKGKAIIDAGNASAIILNKTQNIIIKNLILIGAGRTSGNIANGFSINYCNNIHVENVDISGFQKAGLLVLSSTKININKIFAHENGYAGISVEGTYKTTDCNHISITNCLAKNNPGDPTNKGNHSGNGIVVGYCTNVKIDYCVATNNGWDMPRIGNGPVGIWCYEADSIVIQHCISYRNKTAKGADDGGGFDLDGGVSNSIIQYCLSYENQGSGFGIFQYNGAAPWHNNTIRFNISENDGLVSAAHAAAYIWNSSDDAKQFYNLAFYNNTFYNTKGAAINFASNSARKNFNFYNNIFVAQDSLIAGQISTDIFLGNNWWSLLKQFNVARNYNFNNWATQNNKEIKNGKLVGLNIYPNFYHPDKTTINTAQQLKLFKSYKIPINSPLRNKGIDLNKLFGIDIGHLDFNQKKVSPKSSGASF